MNPDEARVAERLAAFAQRFDAILGLLSGQLPLRGEAKQRAQLLLKELKAGHEGEYRATATVRGAAELSADERAYYLPAVHQPFADIHVKWNSVPNDSWVGNLYAARLSITHMLDQLRRRDA